MSRVLSIPDVQAGLLQSGTRESRGRFLVDSVYKLDAVMRKGKGMIGIIKLVDQIWYVVQHQPNPADSDDFSFDGVRGNTSGNRIYTDASTIKQGQRMDIV